QARAFGIGGRTLARVESTRQQTTLPRRFANGEQIRDGKVGGEVGAHVIEHGSNGGFGAPHDALHVANGAQEVGLVDGVAAAGADKNVLVVVGDADHFVGDKLADGEDAIP